METKLGLKINEKKSGVYPAITRMFLGYEFRRDKTAKAVTAIKVKKEMRILWKERLCYICKKNAARSFF